MFEPEDLGLVAGEGGGARTGEPEQEVTCSFCFQVGGTSSGTGSGSHQEPTRNWVSLVGLPLGAQFHWLGGCASHATNLLRGVAGMSRCASARMGLSGGEVPTVVMSASQAVKGLRGVARGERSSPVAAGVAGSPSPSVADPRDLCRRLSLLFSLPRGPVLPACVWD